MTTAAQSAAQAAGYRNGLIPTSILVKVQGALALWPAAAAAYIRMRTAARAAGINLTITDAYRTLSQQQTLANEKGLHSAGGLAAEPGTSEHGWGGAVDVNVNDPKTLAWLRANAGAYGFANTVSDEAWHWGWIGTSSSLAPSLNPSSQNGVVATPAGIGLPGLPSIPNPFNIPGDIAGAAVDGARKLTIMGVILAGGAAMVVLGVMKAAGSSPGGLAKRAGSVAAVATV